VLSAQFRNLYRCVVFDTQSGKWGSWLANRPLCGRGANFVFSIGERAKRSGETEHVTFNYPPFACVPLLRPLFAFLQQKAMQHQQLAAAQINWAVAKSPPAELSRIYARARNTLITAGMRIK